ncbi:hypothetical protein P0D88_30435 [Paraburkholderia sp. RL18-103-BIB-C]|jgi:hypothetical protein|uniref:hypothetical protein n=1 Tax=unclassified Paraburkholderia TaxID=2615204 RepID=UPI0038B8E626
MAEKLAVFLSQTLRKKKEAVFSNFNRQFLAQSDSRFSTNMSRTVVAVQPIVGQAPGLLVRKRKCTPSAHGAHV